MKHSRRADFFITKKCTNSCIFCSEKFKLDGSDLPFDKIKRVLKEQKKKGVELLHLVGGEPTLHPDFPAILKFAKALGFKIFIITNGVKFGSTEFCGQTLPWLDEIMVSLHGHDVKTHNANTRNPGSFKKILSSLKNLKKSFRGRLEATTAITNENYQDLDKIAALADRFGIKEYQCMSVVPAGEGDKNFFEIVPQYERLIPYLKKVINFCESKEITVRFSGIPMCILGEKYIYSHDLWENFKLEEDSGKIDLWQEPGRADDFEIDIGRIKTGKCRQCFKKEICGGIYEKYFQKYGEAELKPF